MNHYEIRALIRSDRGCRMTEYPTKPLDDYQEYPLEEMRQRLAEFYADIRRRRTVREFSDRPVPRDIIETALQVANTAPSGAKVLRMLHVIGDLSTEQQDHPVHVDPDQRDDHDRETRIDRGVLGGAHDE